MYHVVLLALVVSMAALGWMLVRSAPRVLSMYLPYNLTFMFGAGFFTLAIFSAFTAAFAFHKPERVLESLVSMIVGVWFMFAASSGMRGSESDDALLKRFGAMMALLLGLILATLYVKDTRFVSILSLGLIGGGYFVARDYLRGSRG